MTAGQALRPELMLAYLFWIGLVGYCAQRGAGASRRAACSARPARVGGAAMTALAWRAAGVAVVAALIALWGEIAALKLVSPVFLPTPARAWTALVHGFARGSRREAVRHDRHMLAAGWSPRSSGSRSAP